MDLRNPRAARTILGVLFAGVLMYLNFGTSFAPMSYRALAQQAETLQRRYAKATLENNRARAAAARLPLMQREAERLEQQWEEAQKLLPETTEMDELLREISLAGQANGVEFVQFRPSAPVALEYHTEHPIALRIEGGFDQITGLLRDVATMRRIVSVRDLDLSQIPSQEESPYTARAEFTAIAYTLGGNPAARNPSAGKPGDALKGAGVSVGRGADASGTEPRSLAAGVGAATGAKAAAVASQAGQTSNTQPSFGRGDE
jgi:type IV pilus assembly protein PilO